MALQVQDSLDIRIGEKIRARRHVLGMSQSELGRQLGVTHQQINKYENGDSHIRARTLYRLARILGVDPGHFFEGLDDDTGSDTAVGVNQASIETVCRRDTLELVRLYLSLPDKKSQRAFLQLGRAVSNASETLRTPVTDLPTDGG
ncbi:Transcriptional regulator, contains XRE-family HTH domain [Limimonas halophila]|uniref:Transcriptional regulator, contains XRE-family HTH domain n=1 Tax=Limimonas halophila TaxID=1082479 RepID=A0A1G7TF04_9PROT|nr:helix-turn-helix transcriptional regulator [Limimonas halophila]SDG33614.1 Transcriptional regulator, contains XRE-family HTH domain [Limimonas halophila]